jgi:hypothetical protein
MFLLFQGKVFFFQRLTLKGIWTLMTTTKLLLVPIVICNKAFLTNCSLRYLTCENFSSQTSHRCSVLASSCSRLCLYRLFLYRNVFLQSGHECVLSPCIQIVTNLKVYFTSYSSLIFRPWISHIYYVFAVPRKGIFFSKANIERHMNAHDNNKTWVLGLSLPGILTVKKCLQNWWVSTQWIYANNEVWYVGASLNYLVLLVFPFFKLYNCINLPL